MASAEAIHEVLKEKPEVFFASKPSGIVCCFLGHFFLVFFGSKRDVLDGWWFVILFCLSGFKSF